MIVQVLGHSDWTVRFSALELPFSMLHWRALEVDCTHAGKLARVWYHICWPDMFLQYLYSARV